MEKQILSLQSDSGFLRTLLILILSLIIVSSAFADELFDDDGNRVPLSALKSCEYIGLSEDGNKISLHFMLTDDNVLWFDWGSDGLMDNRQFFPNSSTTIERNGNTMSFSNSMGKIIMTLVTDPVSKRKFYVLKYNKMLPKSFFEEPELTETKVLAVAYFNGKKVIGFEEMQDSTYPVLFDAFEKFVKKCK